MSQPHPAGRGAICAIAAALILLVPVASASAQSDRGRVRVLELQRLAGEGRCDEALPRLEAARREAPGDAELALLEGRCRLAGFDYAGAADALHDAAAADPALRNVQLDLAIALYHLEDFAGAERAIAQAAGNHTPERAAEYHLYNGLLLLGRGEGREAALELERARTADPEQVEPVASFYAGLAWQSVNERGHARESFERVVEIDGDGTWGRQARRQLDSELLADRTWASITLGLDYDSNVILLGDTLVLPPAISGQSDGRFVYLMNGGAELLRTDRWSAGLYGSYAGIVHFDLNEYDVQFPELGGWVDRSLGERSLLRLRYEIGHAWVDYGSFLLAQEATLSLFHTWGEAGSTEAFGIWNWNDFRFAIFPIPMATPPGQTCNAVLLPCSPSFVDTQTRQDRSGNGLRVGFLHRYPLPFELGWLRDMVLRGGYTYGRYWAKGADWKFQGHQLVAGLETDLPWRLDLDLRAAFTYAPFDTFSSYPDPDDVAAGQTYPLSLQSRLDKIVTFGMVLRRPINDWLEVSLRYTYTRNVSNVAVFDYDRNVVGAYATLRF